MKIGDGMTRDVKTIAPDRTIKDAARLMAALDIGTLPVGENDRLEGRHSHTAETGAAARH